MTWNHFWITRNSRKGNDNWHRLKVLLRRPHWKREHHKKVRKALWVKLIITTKSVMYIVKTASPTHTLRAKAELSSIYSTAHMWNHLTTTEWSKTITQSRQQSWIKLNRGMRKILISTKTFTNTTWTCTTRRYRMIYRNSREKENWRRANNNSLVIKSWSRLTKG